MNQNEYEFLVVGGGTAGVVTAACLARTGQVRVALLEAGPPDRENQLVLDFRRWMELLDSPLVRNYPIVQQPVGNSRILHSRAYVLGGCSSHNSVIAFIPPAADFHHWERLGAMGWGPNSVRPYYERVLEHVYLMQVPDKSQCSEAFIDAATNLGFPHVDFLRSWDGDDAVGWLWLNAHGTTRMSSSVAYLHSHSTKPPNLDIYTDTVAYALIIDSNGECQGVKTTRGDFFASIETVLACGAFDTPKLLMLSGIGPADHLQELGLPVLLDLPGVGQNLLDHIEGIVIWESQRPIPYGITQGWEAALFTRLDQRSPWPELMIHFGIIPFDMHTRAVGYPTPLHGFSMTPNVTHPKSRGSIRLSSLHPEAPPLIDPQYFTDPEGHDLHLLVEGIRLARQIANQEPLRSWISREVAPGEHVVRDDELAQYIARTANTVYHPAGTCRMGAADDPLAVVDPQLRVLGIKRLRIADASIFPDMITVNPCLTCMMIGERCADYLIREHLS
ncbi:MAG: GMC family oxidoreductase [Candidatus Methanomethylicaceae archaeon]